MDAVPARLGADINHRVSDAACLGIENLVRFGQSNRHGVDQDVAVIGRVEIHLSANGRHTHAVTVTADAGDHPGQ